MNNDIGYVGRRMAERENLIAEELRGVGLDNAGPLLVKLATLGQDPEAIRAAVTDHELNLLVILGSEQLMRCAFKACVKNLEETN